ncbi:MAG: flagellar biosynthesis anti-sigma factor FlgM [Proteobacteria bacterium]|nr:MAG: flagellar biosynthesis anti-sigma factor FlgM [Pseudomonadota bacterium]PIE67117.1 MAG: flagellar biosynthesis anti-sigma factor FlgM [Deltaproteobacteria bacterium]
MDILEKGPLSTTPAMGAPTLEKRNPEKRYLSAANAPSTPPDTVSLSDLGRAFKSTTGQTQSVPDIREDRIQRIRRQLADGTYRIDGNRLAQSLMEESAENNTVLKQIDTKA